MNLAKKTRKQGFVFVHLQLYIYCLPTSKIWLINKLSLCTFIPNNISLAERWLITTPRLLHHLITSAQKLWVIRQETKDLIKDFYLCFKQRKRWFQHRSYMIWTSCFQTMACMLFRWTISLKSLKTKHLHWYPDDLAWCIQVHFNQTIL